MNKASLEISILEHFPDSLGCILTGSQATLPVFQLGSDIDIVVFDLSHSNVVSHGFLWNDIKIDCTIFPLHDIHNVVINECHDPRGVLLTMIIQGVIFFDTNSIIADIQYSISLLHDELKAKDFFNSQKWIADLSKINKYFQRNLSGTELFVLLCEFVTAISAIETRYQDYWESSHVRKARVLTEKNETVLDEIFSLFTQAMETKNTQPVIDFINRYIEKIKKGNARFIPKYVTIELGLNGWDAEQISAAVVPLIKLNPRLEKQYTYFYSSDLKYHCLYKFDLSICFRLTGDLNTPGFLKELNQITALLKQPQPRFDIIYFIPQATEHANEDFVEMLRDALCRWNFSCLQNKLSVFEKLILAIHVCFEIKTVINLSNQDATQLCEALISKWLFPRPPINETKSGKEFQLLIETRKKKFDHFYMNNKHLMCAMPDTTGEEYQHITRLINTELRKRSFKDSLRFIPDSYFNYFLIEDIHKSRAFLLLVNEIFLMLNLNEDQKLFCLYGLEEKIQDTS